MLSSSSSSCNTIMCMSVAAMVRPLHQGYLRTAGTLGHQVYEELVAIGGVASCLEVSDTPLSILCTTDDSMACFGTEIDRCLCSEEGGCCWCGDGGGDNDDDDGSAWATTNDVHAPTTTTTSISSRGMMLAAGSSKPNIGPCGLMASHIPSSPDNNHHHIPISECPNGDDDINDPYRNVRELMEHVEHLYETIEPSSQQQYQRQQHESVNDENNEGSVDNSSRSSYGDKVDDAVAVLPPYIVVPYLCMLKYSEHAPEEHMLKRCGPLRNYHIHFMFDRDRTNIPQNTLTWLPIFREATSLEFSQHEPNYPNPHHQDLGGGVDNSPLTTTPHQQQPPASDTTTSHRRTQQNQPPRIRAIGDDFIFEGGGPAHPSPMMRSVSLDGLPHVTRIGDNFLRDCTYLPYIDLSPMGGTLAVIGTGCFAECITLTNINMKGMAALSKIGDGFGYGCVALPHVDINDAVGLTSIGEYFLAKCKSLVSIYIQQSHLLSYIGKHFCEECTMLETILFPTSGQPSSALSSSVPLLEQQQQHLPSSSSSSPAQPSATPPSTSPPPTTGTRVKSLPHDFLAGSTSLLSIDLSAFACVESIGDAFLQGCISLTSIDTSPMVALRRVGGSFLRGCTGLGGPRSSDQDKDGVGGDKNNSERGALSSSPLNLSGLSQVQTLEEYFLSGCSNLTTIDFTPLVRVDVIKGKFLARCDGLVAIDISPMVRLRDLRDKTLVGSFPSLRTLILPKSSSSGGGGSKKGKPMATKANGLRSLESEMVRSLPDVVVSRR